MAALLLLVGCDEGQAPAAVDAGLCDRNTCSTGCCGPNGRCLRDDDPAACGTDGRACGACLAGEVCQSGVCAVLFDTADACTAESCRGCCSGSRCVATPSDTYCGAAGAACVLCQFWEMCVAGACALDPNRCGPHNCDGCCEDGYTCVPIRTAELCGSGGLVCENCPEGGYRDCVDGICVE